MRTSGGRLTRSTRVDGNVHARAQRGGAGGGHGKHPSFGARLRVEDATGGRNAFHPRLITSLITSPICIVRYIDLCFVFGL